MFYLAWGARSIIGCNPQLAQVVRPTYNAKLYALSTTFDEARHVEAFNKYLQQRLKRSWSIGRALKGLLDKILTDPVGI